MDLVEPAPALHLLLERVHPVRERGPPREVDPLLGTGLHRVRAEVLLAERLDPLPPRRVRAEDLPRERERLVHDGALLRGEDDLDALPPLVVAVARRTFPGGLLERAHRLRPRPRDPVRLRIAEGQGQDDLRPARAHLAAVNGFAQDRARAQLACEPGHVLGGAGLDVEALAGIVAEPGVAETEDAVPHRQCAQALSDGDVDRAAPARDAHEEPVEEDRCLVPHQVARIVVGSQLEDRRLLTKPRRGRQDGGPGVQQGEIASGGERIHDRSDTTAV